MSAYLWLDGAGFGLGFHCSRDKLEPAQAILLRVFLSPDIVLASGGHNRLGSDAGRTRSIQYHSYTLTISHSGILKDCSRTWGSSK
jgi:hypothetical protein